ncbi:YkgJ family cysteine cluster protein [Arenimonas oryziterrae]|uniref:Fe-S oxidoreductase n=1 Tax=Arenimonas oryziterrae DSM 21050 = YC6267 TaxID=1121015 RepID=A0A091ANS7_9GAMM|nr:YkgJ family cysteine cluster protein [Arenimonas oryziterrae]KFN41006.1 hypothetical protein N789_03750 [Arenimonas oryziterrae DSM 21050 = YC6267]
MSIEMRDDDHRVDPSISCDHCDAVCCRLTVVLAGDDVIPEPLVEVRADGVRLMARAADGWCAALDRAHMRCGIYDHRPGICRKFAMGGAYCRDERERYRLAPHTIDSHLLP